MGTGLNCKQDELAWIVGIPGLEHKIVKCAKFHPSKIGSWGGRAGRYENVWEFEKPVASRITGELAFGCSDACLRPIRPSEGQDETLTWKPVPSPVVKELEHELQTR